jgi:hypothetical protein
MAAVEIVNLLSGLVVVGSCIFLIGLAVVIAIKPRLAERFVRSLASSARAHYIEQELRLLAGAALVEFASSMWHPKLFELFGWVLVVTAVGLMLMPWQWHHRYGTWAIPLVIRHMRLFALGAFALGGFILYGVSRAIVS